MDMKEIREYEGKIIKILNKKFEKID
jgi:hypothetical protein